MPSELTSKRCQACASGAGKLSSEQIGTYLKQLSDWEVVEGELRRTFRFKDYHEVMAFVNATAWISHREDHHPDMEVGYNRVVMRYSTHSAGGLTENDFICAAKVDQLL